MKHKLKVYGGLTFKSGKQERAIIATYNQKLVAQATNTSQYYIQGWWCMTGDKREIELALEQPFKLIFPEERA